MGRITIVAIALLCVVSVASAQKGGKPGGDDDKPTKTKTVTNGTICCGFPDPGTTGLLIQSVVFTDTDTGNKREPEGQENHRQCNNGDTGWKWNWLTEATKPIRFVTDWRWGGCDWSMVVIDSGSRFTGTELRIKWGDEIAAVDGDPKRWTPGNECIHSGTYQVSLLHAVPKDGGLVPMRRILPAADNQDFIRIDTDSRLGACPIKFDVYREPLDKVVEWTVRLYDPGTPDETAICGERLKTDVARVGAPLSYVMNMHDGRGCELTMQLVSYRAHVVGSGESLRSIAAKELGKSSRWNEIATLNKNRLSSPDRLTVGLKLKLPNQ